MSDKPLIELSLSEVLDRLGFPHKPFGEMRRAVFDPAGGCIGIFDAFELWAHPIITAAMNRWAFERALAGPDAKPSP